MEGEVSEERGESRRSQRRGVVVLSKVHAEEMKIQEEEVYTPPMQFMRQSLTNVEHSVIHEADEEESMESVQEDLSSQKSSQFEMPYAEVTSQQVFKILQREPPARSGPDMQCLNKYFTQQQRTSNHFFK